MYGSLGGIDVAQYNATGGAAIMDAPLAATSNSSVFGSTSSIGQNTGGLVEPLSPTQTQASSSAAGYSGAAISAVATVGTTLMSLAAKKDAIEHKNKEISSAMDATMKEYEFMASVNEQQMDAIDRVVGDKMTATGLERLKNKASLRASAAMTGTSGGSTESVIQEAAIIEMLDNAVVVAQGRQQKLALSQKLQGQYMSAMNRLDNLAAGMMSSSGAGFAMIDAGLSGFTKGYMMLPASERRKYFGQSKEQYT